jgi:hypothetical protein
VRQCHLSIFCVFISDFFFEELKEQINLLGFHLRD